jgi:hypothetical protein
VALRDRRISPKLPTRQIPITGPRQVAQVGRNEPCPCGSGKKFKQCHAKDGEEYLRKLAQERSIEETAERTGKRPSWFARLLFGG